MNELLIRKLEDLEKEPFGFEITELNNNDWYQISSFSELSEEFIRQYHDKLDWPTLIDAGVLNESLLNDFHDKIKLPFDWERIITYYEKLSLEFLTKFLDKFHPDVLLENQRVPAKLLYKILKNPKYDAGIAEKALQHQPITPQMLKVIEKADMSEVISWYEISKSGKLSNKSIESLKKDLNWRIMSMYREMSDELLIEYQDLIEWEIASEYQNLSNEIILKFPNKIDIEKLKINKKLDQTRLQKAEIYTMLSLLQVN